jgi:2-polyprenyl-3-methyl-5-hydroxy-6-metoxy-1,4-benzoquinol methylase
MLNTFGAWGTHIPESSLETTIDYVVTGSTINTVEPSLDIISNIQCDKENCTILDFGSGIGRNCIYLAINNPNYTVYAYDNPKMLNKMKEFGIAKYKTNIFDIPNLKTVSEWDNLKNHQFDYIYATLVFQHINESSLDIYLQDIKKMTNNLIIFGRRANDHSSNNTWQILEKHYLLPLNIESYKTHGDPEDHQLAIYNLKGV